MKIDSSLKFYYEVLKLERLHYGLWEKEDSMDFSGLRKAQKRYEDYLIRVINEISGSSPGIKILDVGCGSGEMVKTLVKHGYEAEGLSPDSYQEELFRKKTAAKFHPVRFQCFEPEKQYDVVLMSESAQYIPIPRLFQKAGESLKDKSFLVVSDYFLRDSAEGPQSKSGHNLKKFINLALENGFILEREEDITDKTTPTLELAMGLAVGFVIPTIYIFTDRLRTKHPLAFKALKFIGRRRIQKIKSGMALISPAEFKKNKQYMLFIFRKGAA